MKVREMRNDFLLILVKKEDAKRLGDLIMDKFRNIPFYSTRTFEDVSILTFYRSKKGIDNLVFFLQTHILTLLSEDRISHILIDKEGIIND
jgi:hypothetical protein